MSKTLYVTNEVPKNAVILLVDVQERYFKEVTDFLDFETCQERNRKIYNRLKRMKERLLELKAKGHKVYAIVNEEGIHPILEGIPETLLPSWPYARISNDDRDPADVYVLHPVIVKEMKQAESVVVCGLWLELCVYSVARLLQKQNIRALVSIDPAISLENAMIWDEHDDDVVTLDSECGKHGVVIYQVNQ